MSKAKKSENKRQDIAIVGMSALFPKAPGLKDFWRILRLGTDTITEVPDTHWSPEDYFDADKSAPDMTYCRRGGFLEPYPSHRARGHRYLSTLRFGGRQGCS